MGLQGGFTTHDLPEALPTARGQRCVDLQLGGACSSVWLTSITDPELAITSRPLLMQANRAANSNTPGR